MNWLRAIYIFNGLATASLLTFVGVILQASGFEPALLGLTMSLGSLTYSIALPIWGHVGDVITGPRRAVQLAAVPAALFAFGFVAPLPVAAVVLCCCVVFATGYAVTALTDSIAVTVVPDATEFSWLRMLMAVGMAAGSIAFGFVYSTAGYGLAPFVFLTMMGAVFVCARFLPMGRDSERHRRIRAAAEGVAAEPSPSRRFGSVGEAIALRPRLAAVLPAVTLIFMGPLVQVTFIALYVVDLGGGPGLVGLIQGIGFGGEAAGLVLASFFVARLGARTVLLGSSVAFSVAVLGYILVTEPLLILVVRLTVAFLWCGIFLSAVMTMARILPARLQSTAQTLLQAAGFGGGAILANLLGGVLYGISPHAAFAFAAVSTLAGAALMAVALPTGWRATDDRPEMEPAGPLG